MSDDIIARGATPQSSLKLVYELGVGFGGPIMQDKLWFYTANQWWGSQIFSNNNFFNMSTNPYTYVPDPTRPAYADIFYRDNALRFTWQATQKHKVTQHFSHQLGCQCWVNLASGVNSSPEASIDSINGPTAIAQTSWSYTPSSKFLFQAGLSYVGTHIDVPTGGYALTKNPFTAGGEIPQVAPGVFSIVELNTGYRWGAALLGNPGSYATYADPVFNERVSMSYITGSHSAKAGLQTYQGTSDHDGMLGDNQVNYSFRAGIPSSLTQSAGPAYQRVRLRNLAIYAQDQWTINRLTLNYGLRYDHFWAYTPAVDIPAGQFIAARSVPRVDDLPNFTDMSPRLGAAYDVFGNGRTAIKAAFGKYLAGQGFSQALLVGPSTGIVLNTTRTWNDRTTFPAGDPRNGNFVPDCDLTNLQANDECGTANNLAFGQPITNIELADDARKGWGKREYNYQLSTQLHHELRPGLGLAIGYFRTWWGNHTVEQNTSVTPADFTEYCVTAPTDPRLDTSGERICGYYDVNRDKFGQVYRLVTRAKNFGTQEEIYNGVDIAINARWGAGALVQGGLAVGRQTFDYCYANGHPELTPAGFPANNPRNETFCRPKSPWWDGSGSQIKFAASYPLAWDVNVSGTFKHLPGKPIVANVVTGAAQMAQELGRPLSACPATGVCTATATQTLIPAGGAGAPTQFDERLTQTDLRISKGLRFGRTQIEGIFDIYNVFNNRSPQSTVPTYGSSWLRPTVLLGGRLFKFGTQVNW